MDKPGSHGQLSMADHQQRVKALFNSVVELDSADAQAAYLDEHCRDDARLRAEVLALVSQDGQLDEFLAQPAVAVLETDILLCPDALGARIGPYKLRELIGEGGFGLVYVAEQEQPIRRKVALKVIKPGMDSREVIARFEAERQALALMDHSNIAKVHDAGTTESGRPYFVMELVRGLPITEYCDRAKLALRDRLQLFITVCQAVQHAHQKGIIHRDLKPSNVMITLHDGQPVPKVIDFGVAKALNQKLSQHTVYTRHAQMLGTPMYMSPEQAELSGLDVDTRSDVYSLGVLLYELLTGQTPFDRDALSKLGYDELRRMVRDVEPPRPSARVSTLVGEQRSTVATRRALDERHHSRTLRGELDWIVMQALEKDRARRYGSADALADDLQRYLDDQPVKACPPSWGYRLRKFAWRKRLAVSATAVSLVSSVVLAAAIVVIVRDRDGNVKSRSTYEDGATVTVDTGGQSGVPVIVSKPSNPEREPVIGLLPNPPAIPGIGPWQIITTRPTAPVSGRTWSFDWSPDSQFVVFGNGVEVRVYTVPSFELVHLFWGHTNVVNSVAWSPDGQWIASAGFDATVRLWNVHTGEPGPVLVGHRERVDDVAWHPDSQRLVSGGRDDRAIIWTVDGKLDRVIPNYPYDVLSVAWSPDGELLATGGGRIRIWDQQGTGDLVRTIDTKGYSTSSIAWSHDSQRILSPTCIWNLDGTEFVELKGHSRRVTSSHWSPDGSQIATAGVDNTVRLWSADGASGPVLTRTAGEKKCVKWSPNGQWLASGGEDSPVSLWRPDGAAGPVLSAIHSIPDLAWHPDGDLFAACCNRSLQFFHSDGTYAGSADGYSDGVTRVDWSSAGEWIVSGHGQELTLRKWNQDGTVGPIKERHTLWTQHFDFSPSEPKVAIVFHEGHTSHIGILDPNESGEVQPLGEIDGGEVRWSPQGDRLLSFSGDHKLRVWTLDGHAEIIQTTVQRVWSADWKPDGTQIACGFEDGTIQLCRADGWDNSLLAGHQHSVQHVSWSGDGAWLASGDSGSEIRLWTGAGRPVTVLRGHAAATMELDWRPHSHQLLSAGRDGTIRLWDADSGSLIWVTVALPDNQSVNLRPDGTIFGADPELVAREVAYIIRTPTGATEIVEPAEFQRRIERGRK